MNNETTYNRLVKEDNPFTQILNTIIIDTRISSNAFRLICYFISKPNDWIINLTEAYATLDIGRDAGARAFKDLESVGYLSRVQIKDEKGHLVGYNYNLNENPLNLLNLPISGFVDSSKAATNNTNTINTNTERKEEITNTLDIKEEKKESTSKDILDIFSEKNYKTKKLKAKAYLGCDLKDGEYTIMVNILKSAKDSAQLEYMLKDFKSNIKPSTIPAQLSPSDDRTNIINDSSVETIKSKEQIVEDKSNAYLAAIDKEPVVSHDRNIFDKWMEGTDMELPNGSRNPEYNKKYRTFREANPGYVF